MSDNRLFVDEELRSFTGAQAGERLARTNDVAYVREGEGVTVVPKVRWMTAQSYERKTWMQEAAHATEDRNEEHAEGFGGYAALDGRSIRRAIELGCGPFTNLRIIARHARIGRCVLLDPLIESYVTHRHCTYPKMLLRTGHTRLHERLGANRVARLLRRLVRAVRPRWLDEGVPVERLIAAPIEEMPECGSFDLVVLINVLEHCYDVQAIFRRVLALCPTGSLFVFHDRLFAAGEIPADLRARYDAGHPLRIADAVIESFLSDHFTPLWRKESWLKDQAYGLDLSERGIYFIGERK